MPPQSPASSSGSSRTMSPDRSSLTVDFEIPPHPTIGVPGSPFGIHPNSFHDLEHNYSRYGDKCSLVEIIQCWTSGCWGSEIDDSNIALVFHEALQRGDEYAVRMLLRHARVDPSARGPCDPNLTPLLTASQFGHLELVRLFWYLVGPDMLGSSLVVAARNGRSELVGFLLDMWGGWTAEEKTLALQDAAWAHWDNSVEVLLSRLSYQHEGLQPALEKAVVRRMILPEDETDHLRRIQLGNLTMNEVAADARRRQFSIIRQLVDAGADPNGSVRGNLLCLAMSRPDHTASVEGLLEMGADPNIRGFRDDTPLHYLLRKTALIATVLSWLPYETMADRAMVLRLLLEHGASPSARNEVGETPLHLVAKTGTLEELKMCLSHCRVLHPTSSLLNAQGESLLHYAASSGNEEIVEFLLAEEDDDRVDVNLSNRNGWTPLLCALSQCTYKSEQVVQRLAMALLARGADARVVTDEGWSPLHALASWRTRIRGASCTYPGYDPEAWKLLVSLALELIEKGASLEAEPRFLRDLAMTTDRLYGVWGFRMWQLAEKSRARGDDDTEETGGAKIDGICTTLAQDTTPLAWAIRTNAMDLVQVFLDCLGKIDSGE
ncbi:hypothetical protein PG989_010949 [Apiospora arundinis]|uniref:Ankyrin repeat protein n=1 Tax=Apiospora arundinis TaxID=335852 RepID=A0ABR2HQ53_9PEZI